MKLLIANGRLIDPANGIDGIKNIAIADGKVLAVEDAGKAIENFTPDRTIDALGLVVSPGFVDLSARLREPGYEHKATLASEMQAAMQGGVTSLVCPPDTDPVLDEPGLVEMLKYRAAALNQAHVYPLGALTVGLKGQALTEMAELTDAGCIGFSQANEPIIDTEVLLRALQYANSFNYSTWLQPEDPYLSKKGMAHSGPVAARLGLSGISYIAETIRLHTIFELIRVTGARIHLGRLSSAEGIELVRQAKKDGLPVTCDVGIHHIHLTEDDIDFFDTNARMTPPLRSRADRLAITEGLLDGTIDAICSDHTPVDDDEKLLPFGEATPGATGLELLLSLTLKWGQSLENDPSNLSKAIAKITSDPAGILGKNCGKLSVGDKADICVFDPSESWTVEASKLASQGKHTPFLGREIPGRVRLTIVEGKVTFER
ncbi:dihydroorotase [Oxalobacter formigenes]|uniref:Amidohydrolase family protein n=2 Tax=Oxalobacter TaxID=846 RepID=C3XAN7_OXAFO|nr:dihydroorotase [Oxalobacter formigenes]ARQ45584.1 Dihydroorotase [Oxalobacter formigenes]ARQ77836.1 dihydroorotase [Oxalobacter formigenes OXCC13]EEO30263.1 amidohydrolase family protein [Oxalobacter formigenes OXCC13]MCZ4062019.1 dihydroorotase [Oxalobacter formigenes]QDX33619.1 dihydroorotase [Oxalobacter formigenes]